MLVSYSSSNYKMKIGKISNAIFSNTCIKSHYLVSPEQSIQQYEWRSMLINMNVAYSPMSFLISTNSTAMPFSTKVTLTFNLSITSMAKTAGTNKDVAKTTEKKIKQIMQLSDKKEEEEEEEEEGKREEKY